MGDIHDAIELDDMAAFIACLDGDAGARVVKDGLSNSPLHTAAWAGRTEMVRLLIERGADVNGRGDLNRTPLHFAAMNDYPEVADLLANSKAELAPVDDICVTPLFYSMQGHPDVTNVARVLLDHSVPIDACAGVWLLDAKQMRLKLDAEPRLLAETTSAAIALTQAAIKGDADLVQVLVDHGAPANGVEGERPLISAFWKPEIVKILLEGGANVLATDASGWTMLEWAKQLKASDETMNLLEKYRAI